MQSIRTKDSHQVTHDKSASVKSVGLMSKKNPCFLVRWSLRSIFEVSSQAILKIIFRNNPESTFCGSFCCLFRKSWPSTRASHYQDLTSKDFFFMFAPRHSRQLSSAGMVQSSKIFPFRLLTLPHPHMVSPVYYSISREKTRKNKRFFCFVMRLLLMREKNFLEIKMVCLNVFNFFLLFFLSPSVSFFRRFIEFLTRTRAMCSCWASRKPTFRSIVEMWEW